MPGEIEMVLLTLIEISASNITHDLMDLLVRTRTAIPEELRTEGENK